MTLLSLFSSVLFLIFSTNYIHLFSYRLVKSRTVLPDIHITLHPLNGIQSNDYRCPYLFPTTVTERVVTVVSVAARRRLR